MTAALPDHLLIRNGRDDRDRERFAAFNAEYNNAAEGATCRALLRHHPAMTDDDYWLVEDGMQDRVVATVCLIPWEASYDGVALRVAQLEMVLSHPDYRGQGLVRALIRRFHDAVQSRGYDVSIIWGIPYYYRQFGYGYAGDGSCADSLPVWRVPPGSPGIRLRLASRQDIPTLQAWYDQAMRRLDLHLRRTPAYWAYLLDAAHHPIQMVEGVAGGENLGYAVVERSAGCARVLEHSLAGADAALALLQHLATQAQCELVVSWPRQAALAQIAQSLGSHRCASGQWLLRITDVPGFLMRIAPALERRLVTAGWGLLSASLILNLYRTAFCLRIEGGRLIAVERLGFVDSSMGADGGHLCIPPDAFARLAIGYRSIDELEDAWPDIVVKPAARAQIDSLFPRMRSYISTPYHDLA